jgi:hypothetical protein
VLNLATLVNTGVILEFCRFLESTSISVGIRESTWTYPVAFVARPGRQQFERGVRRAGGRTLLLWSGVGIMGRGIGFY